MSCRSGCVASVDPPVPLQFLYLELYLELRRTPPQLWACQRGGPKAKIHLSRAEWKRRYSLHPRHHPHPCLPFRPHPFPLCPFLPVPFGSQVCTKQLRSDKREMSVCRPGSHPAPHGDGTSAHTRHDMDHRHFMHVQHDTRQPSLSY